MPRPPAVSNCALAAFVIMLTIIAMTYGVLWLTGWLEDWSIGAKGLLGLSIGIAICVCLGMQQALAHRRNVRAYELSIVGQDMRAYQRRSSAERDELPSNTDDTA
jgi:hypothetical protein